MRVVWFRHSDEHRNDLLRFGLMRLCYAKEVEYLELNLRDSVDFGFAQSVACKNPHHASVVAVEDGSRRVRCVIDSEDSFYWMSKLIANCDRYFCAGYNTNFFRHKAFAGKYDWQREEEVNFYRAKSENLIAQYGEYFGIVRPFVPIGPGLGDSHSFGFVRQKMANLHYRVASTLCHGRYWAPDLKSYERRYARLLRLRQEPLRYDVTLVDTLWGWPRHRVALHQTLARLSSANSINSRLSWADPVPFDGSENAPEDRAKFPMATGAINDYETMLAGSRLGVFATGFHWGWRSIMSLAMMVGIPVLADRPLLEPWFNLSELDVTFNDMASWDSVASTLLTIPESGWRCRKTRNAVAYDEVMSPEAVARYFIREALT